MKHSQRVLVSRLTPIEMADIKDMVLTPEDRHMALRTLAIYAQRIGERGWHRPRLRVHPGGSRGQSDLRRTER
jgi:hypothetical protein